MEESVENLKSFVGSGGREAQGGIARNLVNSISVLYAGLRVRSAWVLSSAEQA